jgi:hypothetical protein
VEQTRLQMEEARPRRHNEPAVRARSCVTRDDRWPAACHPVRAGRPAPLGGI